MRVLSLGWGVQSWTLAAMSALGEMDHVDVAIHADTRHERSATYEFAGQWTSWLEAHDIAVETVMSDERKANVLSWLPKSEQWEVLIPVYTKDGLGTGMTHRQCTKEWKIRPNHRMVRSLRTLHRVPATEPTEMWIGISADEFQRARDADVKYITNRFPLLERNMTREDCKSWLKAHDLPVPPKSSCLMCPFHDMAAWREMKRENGLDWQLAVDLDKHLRDKRPGLTGAQQAFLHRHRLPLTEAVDIPEDHGYVQTGFDPEGKCDEGVCWV